MNEYLKELGSITLDKYETKLEQDICQMAVDLEYLIQERASGKGSIVMLNGNQMNYDEVIKNIETGIQNLNKKLNIVRELNK